MDHSFISETSDNMNDQRHVSDISKKPVSQSCTLTRSSYQTSNIPYLDLVWNDLEGFDTLLENSNIVIIDSYFSCVRFDCAERVVAGLGLLGLSHGIE